MAKKKQTKFGQIPFWAICLFRKRAKIEIAVFSYICSQLFDGEADCPRQDIIDHTELDKSQVSTAIKNLTFIKWIAPSGKDKWTVPENEPEKVDDSTTKRKRKKLTIPQQKLTNAQQKVDDSTTKVDDSTTPSYKDSEFTYSSDFSDVGETSSPNAKKPKSVGKKKTEPDPRSKHPAILVLKGLMVRYPKKILYDDLIARLGDNFDSGRLAACFKAWLARGYNSSSYSWLDWYENGIPEQKGNGSTQNNNRPKQSNAETFRNRDASKFAGIDPRETFGIKRR